MKKIIGILILVIAIIIGGVIIFSKEKSTENKEVKKFDDQPRVEVLIASELRVQSYTSDLTYIIDDYEKDLFINEALISMDYLENLYRFLIDYDVDSNRYVIVYQDQTFLIDMNINTITLNYTETTENNLIVLKAGMHYIDVSQLEKLFNIEYYTIEEPFLSIQLDFDSSNEGSNAINDTMESIKATYPEKINMTWEAVYSRATNVEALYKMPGLDVISPVWYDLKDGTGAMTKKTQDDYIEWAGENGYTLWPAITNNFDTEMTHELISSYEYRTSYIQELISIYTQNGFKGINIDFENIYKDDKDALSQFIGELSAAFHRAGIIVSMDVTFAGGSDTWSKCYDRKVLGEWIDYLVVMSYDQHWGSSPISGTVAGLEWLNNNLNNLTKEVEPDKIIMGIPLYMRVWFERPSKEIVNSMKVTSDAITMHKMENILANEDYTMLWDEVNGQNYISYIDMDDNAVKKIWIEDAESLELKIDLVHKFGLKGIASWRRGYELESIWPVLENALEDR